jgi:hypothetical protein
MPGAVGPINYRAAFTKVVGRVRKRYPKRQDKLVRFRAVIDDPEARLDWQTITKMKKEIKQMHTNTEKQSRKLRELRPKHPENEIEKDVAGMLTILIKNCRYLYARLKEIEPASEPQRQILSYEEVQRMSLESELEDEALREERDELLFLGLEKFPNMDED